MRRLLAPLIVLMLLIVPAADGSLCPETSTPSAVEDVLWVGHSNARQISLYLPWRSIAGGGLTVEQWARGDLWDSQLAKHGIDPLEIDTVIVMAQDRWELYLGEPLDSFLRDYRHHLAEVNQRIAERFRPDVQIIWVSPATGRFTEKPNAPTYEPAPYRQAKVLRGFARRHEDGFINLWSDDTCGIQVDRNDFAGDGYHFNTVDKDPPVGAKKYAGVVKENT